MVDTFLNSIYAYDNKVLILLNYKDGEICVTFDDIKAVMDKKENSGNRSGCQSSPLESLGDLSALVSEHLSFVRAERLLSTSSSVTIFSPSLWLNIINNSLS